MPAGSVDATGVEADGLPPAPERAARRPGRLHQRSAQARGDDLGFGGEPAPLEREPEPESYLHVPVLHSAEPQWRPWVGGVVGLMLLVAAAALGAAVAIYQLGCLVNQMIQGFMVDSPAPGDIQPPQWSAPRPSSSRTAE